MVNIVPLSEEHIDEIAKIERESFGDPWSRQMFVELLDLDYAICFVAIENNEVAGYLIAYDVVFEMEIMNIAVKKSKRNMKIASKLFDAVFEYAKSANIEKFTLEVRPSNMSAIALYKKLGFKIVGVRKNYYVNPNEDAILMSLKL